MRTEKNCRELRTNRAHSRAILSAAPSVRDRAGGWVRERLDHDRRHLRPRSGRFAHHRPPRRLTANASGEPGRSLDPDAAFRRLSPFGDPHNRPDSTRAGLDLIYDSLTRQANPGRPLRPEVSRGELTLRSQPILRPFDVATSQDSPMRSTSCGVSLRRLNLPGKPIASGVRATPRGDHPALTRGAADTLCTVLLPPGVRGRNRNRPSRSHRSTFHASTSSPISSAGAE